VKILFVNPACLDKRITDEDARVVPIGLYYMAALLLEKGFDARIINLAAQNTEKDAEKDTIQIFQEVIEKEKPDLIGFSVTNPNRINAVACAKAAKKSLPNAWIVFGGPAPTFMAAHLFTVCPEVDIMVKGEGETTILSLVKALAKETFVNGRPKKDTGNTKSINSGSINDKAEKWEPVRKIKGIALWENNKLVETEPAEPIQNLDALAHPSTYFVYQHLSMSRGCPGKCTFCGSPKFWGSTKIRSHSARWFAQEIQALAQRGVTHFYISDDTFTMDRGRVIDLCKLLVSANLHITWNAISRVDYIDKELLFWMRRAGCIQISFGIESGSQKIKKALGKPISNETCIQAFSLTRSHGIMPRAYFIYGSPGETHETIQESCDLLMQLKPLGTVFYMLVIFPGTHLYRQALQKGRVSDEIWHREIEDLPWFELDDTLDLSRVKAFGDKLRHTFFENLPQFVLDLDLVAEKTLYPFHADFLSRLAMTFSHGEYARIKDPEKIAETLFERALSYSPDPRAFMGIAMLLQKQKKFTHAHSQLAKGLDHFPGNKELRVCMGVCLMNQAKFKEALPFFTPFKDDPGMDHYINICNAKEQTP
jgi:anaerobic magnesium-protoporphyrin IX monomethyl ester cyclase